MQDYQQPLTLLLCTGVAPLVALRVDSACGRARCCLVVRCTLLAAWHAGVEIALFAGSMRCLSAC